MTNLIKKKMDAVTWNRRLAKHEFKQRRMTKGKFTGRQIQELPTSYLRWGVLNLDSYWAIQFARELQCRIPELRRLGAIDEL